MGASAAAVIIIKEKHIVEAFRRVGAVTPDAAVTPDSLGIFEGGAFRILVRDAVLREARPGSYYLDEPSWTAKRQLRRRVVLVLLVIVAVVAAASVWRASGGPLAR